MNLKYNQAQGALLAGACAGIARAFSWNVWVLRALFVVVLLIKPLWAVLGYAALALLFNLLDRQWAGRSESGEELASPELSERGERIAELERRFRELEGRDRGQPR